MLAWIAVPGAMAGAVAPAPPARPPVVVAEPEPDEVMLFALRLDQRTLAESFPGRVLGGGRYLLPLGELCRALGIGIRVDPVRGVAAGFIVEERRRFQLDLGAGTVSAGGARQSLDPSRVDWREDDLYIDPDLLAAWLPLRLNLDPRGAVVEVVPSEPLPVQAEWAREARFGRLQPATRPAAQNLPFLATPYALWDVPFVDLAVDAAWAAKGQPQMDLRSTTHLSGDLLYMSSAIHLTSRRGAPLEDDRITLSRFDPEAGLLGPLRARTLELGNLFTPAVPLIGAGPSGRGVHVGNVPERSLGAPDRHALRGELASGWTAELFHNEVLLAFQRSRSDGLYEFLDVPMNYGGNDYKVVLHGPEGQRVERREWLDLRQTQTPVGRFQYDLAWTRGERGGPQYLAHGAYGLAPALDVRVALARVGAASGSAAGGPEPLQDYASAGLQGYGSGWNGSATVARDGQGGWARSATLATGWGRQSLTLQQTFLSGFSSPEFRPLYGAIASRSKAVLNLARPGQGRRWPVQLGLEAAQDRLQDGGAVQRLGLRLGTFAHGLSLSNLLLQDRVRSAQGDQEQRQGSLMLSRYLGGYALRGELEYGLRPGPTRLRSLALQGETYRLRPWVVQTGLHKDLLSREVGLSAGLLRHEGPLGLQFNLGYARAARWTAGASLRLSLGREPRTGRWLAQAQSLAGTGAVSAVAFLDRNGTGLREPGEPALTGVGLALNGTPRAVVESVPDSGVVFQANLGTRAATTVNLATETLEDPYLRPRTPGYRILARPGKVVRLDFPVVIAGEITGCTQRLDPDGPRDLAGLALELLDAGGALAGRATSAFDGFFDLTDLPPGTYTLRVAPGEAERLRVTLPPAQTFAILPGGTVHEGVRIQVRPGPAEAGGGRP